MLARVFKYIAISYLLLTCFLSCERGFKDDFIIETSGYLATKFVDSFDIVYSSTRNKAISRYLYSNNRDIKDFKVYDLDSFGYLKLKGSIKSNYLKLLYPYVVTFNSKNKNRIVKLHSIRELDSLPEIITRIKGLINRNNCVFSKSCNAIYFLTTDYDRENHLYKYLIDKKECFEIKFKDNSALNFSSKIILNDDGSLWVKSENKLYFIKHDQKFVHENIIDIDSLKYEDKSKSIVTNNLKKEIGIDENIRFFKDLNKILLYGKSDFCIVDSLSNFKRFFEGAEIKGVFQNLSNLKSLWVWCRYNEFEKKSKDEIYKLNLDNYSIKKLQQKFISEFDTLLYVNAGYNDLWFLDSSKNFYYYNDLATNKLTNGRLGYTGEAPYDMYFLSPGKAILKYVVIPGGYSRKNKKFFLDVGFCYGNIYDKDSVFKVCKGINKGIYNVSSSRNYFAISTSNKYKDRYNVFLLDEKGGFFEKVKPLLKNIFLEFYSGSSHPYIKVENFGQGSYIIDLKFKKQTEFVYVKPSHEFLRINKISKNAICFKFNLGENCKSQTGTSINLKIFDDTNKKIGFENNIPIELKNDSIYTINYNLIENYKIEDNKKYTYKLSFESNHATAHLTLKDKVFYKSFWQTKEAKTIYLFLLLLFTILISQHFKASIPYLSKWLPLFICIMSSVLTNNQAVINALDDNFVINGKLFLGMVVLFLFFAFLSGYLSPYIFRQIAVIAPFHWLRPVALSLSTFKKRYYKAHITSIVHRIENERKNRANEVYVPIPAKCNGNKKNNTELLPVENIIEKVKNSTFREAPHILIVAPGGQGKSALLREIVSRYILEFNTKTNMAVPIYVNAMGASFTSVKEILKSQLKHLILDEDTFEKDIKDGQFCLFLDGLSESQIDAKVFGDYVQANNDLGRNTKIIAVTRPDKNYERKFNYSRNFLKVVPQKLDNSNISVFEQAYLGKNKKLPDNILTICKDSQGKYLPLIVKLAMIIYLDDKLALDDKTTINTIYNNAIRKLAKHDTIRNDLVQISLKSYLNKGRREVFLKEDNEIAVKMYAKSGVLIPIHKVEAFKSVAREYRFFHDSVQTYLAAYGIYQKYDNREDGYTNLEKLFYNLATHSVYKKDNASLIFNNGSEVFQMAVLEFEDRKVDLLSIFETSLIEKGKVFQNSFSINSLKACVPPILKDTIKTDTHLPLEYHHQAIAICKVKLYWLSEYFHNVSVRLSEMNVNLEEKKSPLQKSKKAIL